MASSGFEELGKLIERVLRNYGHEKKVKEIQALTCWDEAVGERIAKRARPVKIEDGKLFVEVKSSIWRSELYLLKPRIIEKINKKLQAKIVKEIVLV